MRAQRCRHHDHPWASDSGKCMTPAQVTQGVTRYQHCNFKTFSMLPWAPTDLQINPQRHWGLALMAASNTIPNQKGNWATATMTVHWRHMPSCKMRLHQTHTATIKNSLQKRARPLSLSNCGFRPNDYMGSRHFFTAQTHITTIVLFTNLRLLSAQS